MLLNAGVTSAGLLIFSALSKHDHTIKNDVIIVSIY